MIILNGLVLTLISGKRERSVVFKICWSETMRHESLELGSISLIVTELRNSAKVEYRRLADGLQAGNMDGDKTA